MVRLLDVGTPVVPLDGLTRPDYQVQPAPFGVEFKTNKNNNSFEPGDELVLSVVNHSDKDLHIELTASSTQGKKTILTPRPVLLRAGQEYRFPEEGAIRIQPRLGREQITLFASDAVFPAGELLRGQGVVDRIVHPFYQLRRVGPRIELTFDPARVVKKTLVIETR